MSLLIGIYFVLVNMEKKMLIPNVTHFEALSEKNDQFCRLSGMFYAHHELSFFTKIG